MVLTVGGVFASHLYTADELSSNLITSICQDRKGYIWIGTEYGLNKFDGVHFTQYYNDDAVPHSLIADNIRRLLIDKRGRIWVVSSGGVQQYIPVKNNFQTVSFKSDVVDVTDILQTPDGELWVLNSAHGIFQINTDDMTASPVEEMNKALGNPTAGMMYLDAKGRLWLNNSRDGLLIMYDTKAKKKRVYEESQIGNKNVTGMAEDAQFGLVAVTHAAVLRLNEQTGQFETLFSLPSAPNVRRVYRNRQGDILVGSYGSGIHKVDLQQKRLVPVYVQSANSELNIAQQKIFAYFEDNNSNIWLGCYQQGLVFLPQRPYPFKYLGLDNLAIDNGKQLQTVFSDRHGHFYVGQEGNGLAEIGEDGAVKHQWLQGTSVISAYQDQQENLWVGTYNKGVFRINPSTGEVRTTPLLNGRRVKAITADKQGNIYLAILDGTLQSLTPDLEQRTLGGGNMKLHNRYLNTVTTDRDGRIWIGHYYGIDIYDPQKDMMVDIPVDSILRIATTYAIVEAKDGMMWIGTNKGLFGYEKGKRQWRRYTTKDGLPNNIICGIVEDQHGHLWLSTYHGLCQMSPKDGSFVNYYKGNGIANLSYLRGVYGKSPFGQAFFGNDRGLLYFSPANINRHEFLHGITLTNLILNQQSVELPEEDPKRITLSYEDNTFTLQFSSMDFREVQNVYYEYRFADEAADLWHQTSHGQSEITFTHLSSGKHQLQVRAVDNGVRSKVKQIEIRITPPWYRSWWAYTLYILLLGGVVAILWLYWRHKQLADTNESKIRFFVDISHELRSPLTLIKSPLDRLLGSEHDPNTIRALQNMQRNVDRLLQLVNQILSIRKIEKGQMTLHFAETNMTAFVGDICKQYDYLVEKHKIQLSFYSPIDPLNAWIDREHFDKVVSNLINNALKYVGDGGKVDVELIHQPEQHLFRLAVRDNGPGIDEDQLRKVFERFYQTSARPVAGQMGYGIGLNLAHQIVKLHGGDIKASNRGDGHGAEFLVTVPLGNGHLAKEQLVESGYFSTSSPAPTVVTPAASSPERPERKHRKKTSYQIAVVDDDDEMRNFLITELSYSYHVRGYANGKEALEGITNQMTDLVISDVMMPVMDGYTLLKRLKNNTRTTHLPVILLTTKTELQSRIEGLEQGADAYLDKPFDMEELEACVAGLIENRNRMKGKFSGVQEQEGQVRQIELKGIDEELMEKMMKTINERLSDSDFNVDALADAVGLSRVQLHRRVKKMMGISVGEFIRNLRLQQAAKLLEKGDMSVAQVTYAVGMANPTHFTVAFAKYFGVTPMEYMTKHSKKEE